MNVDGITSTRYIGCSHRRNATVSHFEQVCVMEDGSTKIMYSSTIHYDNGSTAEWPLTEDRPQVDVPANIPEVFGPQDSA